MTKKQRFTHKHWAYCGQLFVSSSVILLAFLMFIPIHTALSAGLAGVSLVVFGLAVVGIAPMLPRGTRTTKPLLMLALGAAILGCFIPQLAYINTAKQTGVRLAFDARSYVTFSGTTTMKPARTMVYKTTNTDRLNLAYYPSSTPGTYPVVALLHGGGWRYGNYLETGEWPRLLTQAGFSVISVQYRLASDTYHPWQDAPADIHDAINFIKSHATGLSVDPSQIHLLGQSAGGHLALLEAYTGRDIQSVTSLYAPVDLALDYQTSRDKSAEIDFIGGPPSEYPDRYRLLSPTTHVSPASPPSLVIQGERDDLVATQNAVVLGDALRKNNVEHDVLYLPMTGHSFENQRGGFATQIAEQRVVDFLKRSIKN
jgi:acetyl esterase/lipase